MRALRSIFLLALCVVVTSCSSSTDADPTPQEITVSGTISNIPDGGLPSDTKAYIIWESHRADQPHEVLVVGQEITLDPSTGAYSFALNEALESGLQYSGGLSSGLSDFGVGYVILTKGNALTVGDVKLELDWSSVIGGMDKSAIVYRGSGSEAPNWITSFPHGFSFGSAKINKPVSKDAIEHASSTPQMKLIENIYFPDWH